MLLQTAAGRGSTAFCLTRRSSRDHVAQIPNRGVDLFQVPATSLERFAVDFAHQRDHVAQIANARLGQIPFLGALARPGRDFVQLGLQPVQVGAPGAAKRAAKIDEISNQGSGRRDFVIRLPARILVLFHLIL